MPDSLYSRRRAGFCITRRLENFVSPTTQPEDTISFIEISHRCSFVP
jgi:hypothetical protein